MLTWEEDVDAHALRRQGWSISAIARHLGHDRKTIRAYLNGERVSGYRRQSPDAFMPFLEYCRQRLSDDPHLWASTLFEEGVELRYAGGYSTFTRALRRYQARPHCEPCRASNGRDVAIIAHPPGEEIQFDWVELPDPSAEWGVGAHAHLLVSALSHSGRWGAVLAEAETFPHLVQALDLVLRRLGGTARRWRFDRMSTVCHPPTGRILPTFAAVAKYYGADVDICPPRRGNRKGVVEKANHSAAQRWWRTVPDGISLDAGQSGVDKLAVQMDSRKRKIDGSSTTVGALAEAEPVLELPVRPFPAELEQTRIVSPQGLVSFAGNCYSVPPGLPKSPSASGWAKTTCMWSQPDAPWSPSTAGHRTGPGKPSAIPDTSSPSNVRCWPLFPTKGPAAPKSADRRRPRPRRKPKSFAAGPNRTSRTGS